MITDEMTAPVGRIYKPHSYKGEMNVDILYDRSIFRNRSNPFFVKIDNILVPFFVDSVGGGADKTSYLKFRGVESDSEAAAFANKELYMLKADLASALGVEEDELEVAADEYIGFSVTDMESGEALGEVEDFEEGVEYGYMVVRKHSDGETISIPFVDEFVREVREGEGDTKGEFLVSLPEGFLDL